MLIRLLPAVSLMSSKFLRSTTGALKLKCCPNTPARKVASCAVVFAGAVEHRCIVIHQSARGGQLFAAETEVKVARVVIGEVVP